MSMNSLPVFQSHPRPYERIWMNCAIAGCSREFTEGPLLVLALKMFLIRLAGSLLQRLKLLSGNAWPNWFQTTVPFCSTLVLPLNRLLMMEPWLPRPRPAIIYWNLITAMETKHRFSLFMAAKLPPIANSLNQYLQGYNHIYRMILVYRTFYLAIWELRADFLRVC